MKTQQRAELRTTQKTFSFVCWLVFVPFQWSWFSSHKMSFQLNFWSEIYNYDNLQSRTESSVVYITHEESMALTSPCHANSYYYQFRVLSLYFDWLAFFKVAKLSSRTVNLLLCYSPGLDTQTPLQIQSHLLWLGSSYPWSNQPRLHQ